MPRPLAPDMILRGFDVPKTQATHVRMRVLSNQCTGSPVFSAPEGTLETDPLSNADCTLGSAATPRRDRDVRAAELQVFSREASVAVTPTSRAQTPTTSSGTVCASTAGFSSARAVPRRQGLRFAFTRRVQNPVSIDVFRQSSGRRTLANRLVRRFRNRSRSFDWKGGRNLGAGLYFARFRVRTPGGRTDFRRTALRRRGTRFKARPAFYRRARCGLLTSYKLSSAACGGRTGTRLGIAFQVGQRARVSVAVLKGKRVVKSFKTFSRNPGRTHRLRLTARGLRRGDYKVRVRAVSGSRRVTAVLVARRL